MASVDPVRRPQRASWRVRPVWALRPHPGSCAAPLAQPGRFHWLKNQSLRQADGRRPADPGW